MRKALWALFKKVTPEPVKRLLRPVRGTIARLRPKPAVCQIARANTKRAYNLIYGKPFLLSSYLTSSRLALYEEMADYCLQCLQQGEADTTRIADLGCGAGHFLAVLAAKQSGRRRLELWGIDYARRGIARARKLLPNARLSVQDIYTNSLPSGYFDLVTCIETLEHLDSPDAALRQMLRVSKDSGLVVLSVPNGLYDHFEGHANKWTCAELEDCLKAYGGAEVKEIRYGRILRARLDKKPRLNKAE